MGMLDNIKTKVQSLVGSHGDQGKEAVDKGAEMADDKTGGKHSDHIDEGADAGKDAIDDAAAASKE